MPKVPLPLANAMRRSTRLLAMVAADREWNEGAARAKLLKIFEAIGLEDEWVWSPPAAALSKILFG